MRQSHADVKMLPEFKSDEDAEFVKTLFEKTLINYNERLEYIEKFTRNWDVERIVFMDNLIMATAITELVSFPSIPVKVTSTNTSISPNSTLRPAAARLSTVCWIRSWRR